MKAKLTAASSDKACDVEWRSLAEATLAQLICFNRRRAGEVSRMKVEDYERKTTSDLTSDIQQSLGPLERNLCKLFSRVELRGKRGRTVPLLLTEDVQRALDVLACSRERAGVTKENVYMFALSHSDNYIRGWNCLHDAANKCGAAQPERLRSIDLRKHVATLCQMFNMKKNELDLLAQFMGHDISVHRQYYRLPSDTMQMAHIAKIFLLMENGSAVGQQGKSLSDIEIPTCHDSVGMLSIYVLKYCYCCHLLFSVMAPTIRRSFVDIMECQ